MVATNALAESLRTANLITTSRAREIAEAQIPITQQLAAEHTLESVKASTMLSQALASSTLETARAATTMLDRVPWGTAMSALDSWRPALMRWPRLPEAVFMTGLPEIERSVYTAIRPGITSIAQQLRDTYDLSAVNVRVHWADAPTLDGFFDLDLDHLEEQDFDIPLGGGTVITVPPRETPTKPRKPPEFSHPFDAIDTTITPKQPPQRRVFVWTEEQHPRLAKIAVTGVATGAGSAVGCVASGYMPSPLAASLGSTIGYVAGEIILVYIEKYYSADECSF
jgi:hypothetical protein